MLQVLQVVMTVALVVVASGIALMAVRLVRAVEHVRQQVAVLSQKAHIRQGGAERV